MRQMKDKMFVVSSEDHTAGKKHAAAATAEFSSTSARKFRLQSGVGCARLIHSTTEDKGEDLLVSKYVDKELRVD